MCVLNNYFTIFSNMIRVKNLAWVGRWQTGNSSKVGQKLGRPLNYYDELSSHVIFFSLLLLSLSQLWFFYSHFERSRFSDMNENACFFSVTEAFLTAQFATIFFCCCLFFILFSSENRKRKANNGKIVKAFEKIHIKGRGLDVCYNKQCFLTLWLPFCSK